ncbi:ribulose-phosphate 3-epimerase [Vagococcus sp. BWB3-3]|uniref:Ribulose-phosphate 3-epimerase n=1 Tax=Vagococcus allomyrinae TaxID=2794353 RepID=A0A940PE07_9ENTE|nr:ribulose-phosphate 3-epimerase [Vagococcus allomyrinae]MBP1042243.1 ribulose-phosphate 3-epimerase [Vagococcus allomyrinae]
MALVAPSILAADFNQLGYEIKDIDKSGADYIHIDSMDGHFVPNVTFGPDVVKGIRKITDKILDCHLLFANPDNYIEAFSQAGADIITVHYEACPHIHRTIQLIKAKGVKAGVALNPGSSPSVLATILPEVDLVLQMTVDPGYGGQSFIERTLHNIAEIHEMRQASNLDFVLEVDGGITENTGAQCVAAGVDVLVAGSYVFNQADRRLPIERLKKIER